jgi:hypothetical protein
MFTMIRQVAEQLKIITDEGITFEIKDFLGKQSNIKEFKVQIDKLQYRVLIKLNEYSLSEAKKVFYPLVRYIQYNSTFYGHKVNEDSIEFLLISAYEDKTGFFCHVIFSQ